MVPPGPTLRMGKLSLEEPQPYLGLHVEEPGWGPSFPCCCAGNFHLTQKILGRHPTPHPS